MFSYAFQLAFDQHPTACLLIKSTSEFPIYNVNNSFLKLTQNCKQSLIGQTLESFYSGHSTRDGYTTCSDIKSSIERTLSGGTPDCIRIRRDFICGAKDSEETEAYFYQMMHTPLFDKTGKPAELVLQTLTLVTDANHPPTSKSVRQHFLDVLFNVFQPSANHFEYMINGSSIAWIGIDRSLRIVSFNPAAEALFNTVSSKTIGTRIDSLFPDSYQKLLRTNIGNFIASNNTHQSFTIVSSLSAKFVAEETEIAVTLEKFPSEHNVASITFRRLQPRIPVQVSLDEERLKFATDAAEVGIWDWDIVTGALTWSDACYDIFGIPRTQAMRYESFLESLHPADRPNVEKSIRQSLQFQTNYDLEYRIKWPDQSLHWVQAKGRVVRDKGNASRMSGTIIDITERKFQEELTNKLAHLDPLTTLPNRSALQDTAKQMLAAATRGHHSVAFLFIDLDRFKAINDIYGHNIGDRLLKKVALRLSSCVRGEDIVCRLGGDEFVALLAHIHDEQDVARVGSNLLEKISQPYQVNHREFQLSCSIGASLFPKDGVTVDELINHADSAMYQAKKSGRNAIRFYRESLNTSTKEVTNIEKRLKRALKLHELELFFQPIIDLESKAIASAEALLRWPTTQYQPTQFIPIAESAGMMQALNEWVLIQACRTRREWYDAGLPAFPISVNISASTINERNFVNLFMDVISSYQLLPEDICLEFNETVIMADGDTLMQVLFDLQALGIDVVLDNFGTGTFNIKHLNQLPVKSLKINHSLVNEINTGGRGAVVSATLALGQCLGIDVIAKGVESEVAANFLRTHHCHFAQGLLFSPPINAENFINFVSS